MIIGWSGLLYVSLSAFEARAQVIALVSVVALPAGGDAELYGTSGGIFVVVLE